MSTFYTCPHCQETWPVYSEEDNRLKFYEHSSKCVPIKRHKIDGFEGDYILTGSNSSGDFISFQRVSIKTPFEKWAEKTPIYDIRSLRAGVEKALAVLNYTYECFNFSFDDRVKQRFLQEDEKGLSYAKNILKNFLGIN